MTRTRRPPLPAQVCRLRRVARMAGCRRMLLLLKSSIVFMCLRDLPPPKGGDVYTGEISMFPSPGDDLKATLSKVMRSSDNLEEGEDDEDEYEDCESNF